MKFFAMSKMLKLIYWNNLTIFIDQWVKNLLINKILLNILDFFLVYTKNLSILFYSVLMLLRKVFHYDKNTPLLFFVLWAPILPWINISSSLILFGLYYGFLTTLPIDLFQILFIRTFFLEGNLSGTMAISSLIIG
jgi:hypothetical protein